MPNMRPPKEYHHNGKHRKGYKKYEDDPNHMIYYPPYLALRRFLDECDYFIEQLYKLMPLRKSYNRLNENQQHKYRNTLERIKKWVERMEEPYKDEQDACGYKYRSARRCKGCKLYTPKCTKEIVCPVCNQVWEVDVMYNRTFICPNCQDKREDYPAYYKRRYVNDHQREHMPYNEY